jgi:hypothetical protein
MNHVLLFGAHMQCPQSSATVMMLTMVREPGRGAKGHQPKFMCRACAGSDISQCAVSRMRLSTLFAQTSRSTPYDVPNAQYIVAAAQATPIREVAMHATACAENTQRGHQRSELRCS